MNDSNYSAMPIYWIFYSTDPYIHTAYDVRYIYKGYIYRDYYGGNMQYTIEGKTRDETNAICDQHYRIDRCNSMVIKRPVEDIFSEWTPTVQPGVEIKLEINEKDDDPTLYKENSWVNDSAPRWKKLDYEKEGW